MQERRMQCHLSRMQTNFACYFSSFLQHRGFTTHNIMTWWKNIAEKAKLTHSCSSSSTTVCQRKRAKNSIKMPLFAWPSLLIGMTFTHYQRQPRISLSIAHSEQLRANQPKWLVIGRSLQGNTHSVSAGQCFLGLHGVPLSRTDWPHLCWADLPDMLDELWLGTKRSWASSAY